MPSTAVLALPYPSLSDAPNGPQNLQDLAAAAEAKLANQYRRAMLRVVQTTTQSLPSGTFTSLNFDTEVIDDDKDGVGGHSTVTNTSRFTCRIAGKYLLNGGVGLTADGTGARGCRWAVNGTALNSAGVMVPTVSGQNFAVAARPILVALAVGDYVELQGYQSSGASLNTLAASDRSASMDIFYLQP